MHAWQSGRDHPCGWWCASPDVAIPRPPALLVHSSMGPFRAANNNKQYNNKVNNVPSIIIYHVPLFLIIQTVANRGSQCHRYLHTNYYTPLAALEAAATRRL